MFDSQINIYLDMQAIILEALHQPLQYKSIYQPVPRECQELVQLKAAALNHRDVWISKGKYPGLVFPIVPGSDGAGIIGDREVIINPSLDWGDDPRFQQKNYRILGLPDQGTLAESIAIDTKYIYDKPAHLSMDQAAALPLAGLTAYRAIFTKCQVKTGEKVLISGVGGGVALFACQFAIAAGAEVYVTSSSDEKISKAVEMGAKGGFNYNQDKWYKDLQAQIGGVDAVIDSAAGEGFSNLVKACNPGARLAIYGGTSGSLQNISPQIIFYKQLTILGSTMGTDEEFAAMLDFVYRHKIVPVVDSVYDLKDANLAFERMDQGLQFGKIVLKI